MTRARRGALGLALGFSVALSGCGYLSPETEQSAKEAVCAYKESTISSMKAGGATARTTASVIRDLAEDGSRLKEVAGQVANNSSDKTLRSELASLLKDTCE